MMMNSNPSYVAPKSVKKKKNKQGKQSAANQPQLAQLLNQVVQMVGGQKGAQIKQALAGAVGGLQQQEVKQGDNSKLLLNEWITKMTGKAPTKAEIVYNTFQVPDVKPDQFVSHLVLTSVDPTKTYSGDASPSKKAAEVSAAAAALKENGIVNKAAAKGKTKKSAASTQGPKGPELSRQRLGMSPIFGTIVRCYGSTGWIKPSVSIDHPESDKHKGLIYVHKQDLQGMDSLEKDMNVVFSLFSDAAGLGAEEVMLAS